MRNQNIFFSDISEIGLPKQPVSHTPTKLSRGAKVDEIRDIKDVAKAVREYVKKKYPNCKFSVTIERFAGGQSMTVSLQEADFNPLTNDAFWDKGSDVNKYFSVNKYQFEKSDKLTDEAIAVLKDVRDFYMQYNYDYSEPQSDYFNVRFYEDITIGKWDKGFIQVAKKSKTSRTPRPAPEKGGEQPKYAVGSKIMYKTSRGSESGKVLGSKFLASKDSYLYEIENPRGDTYRIWESNIISSEEMPELPKTLFNVGQIVTIKGQTDKFSILSIINYEGEISYEVQRLVDGGTAYLPETALELAIEDKKPATPQNLFNVGQTVRIKGRPEKYVITEVIPKEKNGLQMYEAKYTETGDLFPLVENTLELVSEKIELPSTDKRTWNERFNIGDQVKVRWDFSTDMGNGLSQVEYNSNANLFTITQSGEIKDFKRIQNPSGFLYTLNNGKTWEGKDLELALDDETLENKFTFKVGDVFRRNTEDEKPPNTKITYTILSIGEEKTQYRIDYLDKGTNRLSTKSNETITEEITNDWWIPYEFIQVENNSLQEAISQLRDENDAMSEMYLNSEDPSLRKELRESSNENSTAINDFSADLFFEPQKFMNQYFNRATEKFSYDNSELSNEEFAKIIESDEFINWFGDFRKPISEKNLVSKVVGLDDTRQPLIVYHGTWNKTHFSRFKFKKFPVIYFATNKSYAEWFAKLGTGIIYQCFLDIKYLCDFRPLGASSVTWSELSLFLNKQYGFFLPQKETKNAKLPVWAWIRNDAPNFDLINTIKEQGFTGMAHIEDNPQDILPNGEKNITTAYMIFSPEQAKLVRYVSTGNAFTDIFFMKNGGKLQNALIDRIKNLKL
jgi:hypothetical protein